MMTSIPFDWLICRTTLREVESQLAADGVPEVWLEAWQLFRSQIERDDELWEYDALVEDESVPADRSESSDRRTGYAILRFGEVVNSIPCSPWS